MKYAVKCKKSIDRMSDEQLLKELLYLRGVEDVETLLKIDEGKGRMLFDSYRFNNMNDGLDLFYKHLEDGSPIHLLMDVDVDGCTSSAVMYLWIKKHYPNVKITFDCNEGKKHGITRDIINRIPEDVQLLITPDSSSSDVEQHIELWESGIDILVLDHHEFDKEAKTPAVIINCMDGNYPNTSLTGVGVVYKFLQQYEFDMGWDCKYLNELLPLVALGQLADLADVRELETRTLCRQGMQDFDKNNLLLNEIVREQEYSMKGQCNFTSIGWYVAPLMNAIFREGTLEDRYDLFKAICNFEEQRIYEPKRKTKDNPNKEPVVETLQKNIIRRAKSIKSHQDNEVKKEYKQIQELVDDTNKILIIDVTDKILPGHSGLIANKLAHQYMRPVILLNGDGGSGRGYDKFPIDDFNNWLTESGLIKCSGHANAFGIDFNRNDIELLQNWCNEQLDGVDIEPTWHVDFMFDIAKLKSQHILRVGKFEQFWGGKCMEEPLFAITGIQIETGDVQRLGQSQTMMKFTTNINGQEIDFVRPFTGEEMYKQFVCENNSTRGIGRNSVGNKKIDVTVIGKFKVNNFAGKDFPQIEIVAFETSVATGRNRRRNF